MSKIRALAPRACPQCNAEGTLVIAADRRLTCRRCGYRAALPQGDSATEQAAALDKPAQPIFRLKPLAAAAPVASPPPDAVPPVVLRQTIPVVGSLLHTGEIGVWARAAYETGLGHVRRQEWAEAIKAFLRALDDTRDLLDAHLWIGRIAADPVMRRNHLSEVIAIQPNNLEAMRELMLLNGQLTLEEAARGADAHHQPEAIAANAPVSAQAAQLQCPVCGGMMTTDPQNSRQMQCAFCGHVAERSAEQDYGLKSLGMALLKQRGQAVAWVVGERLLHCQTCGAERTLPATQMAARCPFCSSRYVVETDALGSFQQPDGLVPFDQTQAAAEERVYAALSGGLEKFKGLFINNRVAGVELEGVYLPCWLFDTVLQVNRTILDHGDRRDALGRRIINPYRHETLTEMANDWPVFAVKSPPRHLLERLGYYDVAQALPYENGLLAGYSAEIYALDFEAASLIAREAISTLMRERHGQTLGSETTVNVMTLVQQMQFRLVLLPVWVATVTEADGDLRPVLVNGQTGQVALGKARKP